MRKTPKTVAAGLFLLTLLVGCGPVAESQTLRERLAERRAERLTGQGGGGLRGPVTIPAGVQQAQITVNGLSRSFYYHVPAGGGSRPGAVLALHGGGSDAGRFIGQVPSLRTLADRQGFVAVYPNGIDQWNDGRASFAGKPDDVAFLRAVVSWLESNLGVDRSRVFSFGPSNGGVMSYKLACDAPDLVAGIAPMIANFNESLYASCRPSQGTPVAIFNGTEDPLMVYEGGTPTSPLGAFAEGDGEPTVGTETTVAFWARVNNCSGRSARDLPDRANDGTTVTLVQYDCPRDAVWLYRINGGGHTIPGGPERGAMAERLVGRTSQEFDAVAQAVEFFQRYGL